MSMTTWIGLAAIVAVVAYAIIIFNRLVTLKNRFKNAFAQIDVQLKRRHDLIPNLVETAQGYMTHERETLARVTEARNGAVNAQDDARSDPGDGGKMKNLGNPGPLREWLLAPEGLITMGIGLLVILGVRCNALLTLPRAGSGSRAWSAPVRWPPTPAIPARNSCAT